MINKFKNYLIRLHKWNQRQWLVVSLFCSTLSVWFSLILTYCGEYIHFIKIINGKRSLTPLGLFLTILVILFNLLLVCAQKYYDYIQSTIIDPSCDDYVYTTIMECISSICISKRATLLNLIHKIKSQGSASFPIISQPTKQLDKITTELSNCLSRLLTQKHHNLRREDIKVDVFYKFKQEDDCVWKIADNSDPEGNLTIDELLNGKSALKQIINSDTSWIFWNSKEDARKHDCYMPDMSDECEKDNSLKGSIACLKFNLMYHNTEYINAIITIGTYSKKFVSSSDEVAIENTSYNMKNVITSEFKRRVEIELCALYLQHLNNKQKK